MEEDRGLAIGIPGHFIIYLMLAVRSGQHADLSSTMSEVMRIKPHTKSEAANCPCQSVLREFKGIPVAI